MMKQYFEVKDNYRDYLLFYRLGDFYEMFFDDAITASRELELTLTGRDCGEAERAPMCGVPYHSVEPYIARLLEKGYKIAICEQMEDPALAKGLVKREIVRIITPGTVLESNLLNEAKNNYLCAICIDDEESGICFADVSTGQVYATFFAGKPLEGGSQVISSLQNEMGTYAPSEVLLDCGADKYPGLSAFVKERLGAALECGRGGYFDVQRSCDTAERQFGGILNSHDREHVPMLRALGAIVLYAAETQRSDVPYIKDLNIYENGRYMQLDLSTRRNLELTEAMRTKEKRGTLLWVLDKTKSAAGARMLRQWVEHPLLDIAKITRRQSAVGELAENAGMRADIAEVMSGVRDLERLISRIVFGNANARDLRAVAATLSVIPEIKRLLGDAYSEELIKLRDAIDPLEDVCGIISSAVMENPPFTVREGGIIADGYSPEVDRLRNLLQNGRAMVEEIVERERQATGIKTMKAGNNSVLGYYIEVSKSFIPQVPAHFIRRATLANAERYTTEELKKTDDEIAGAYGKLTSLEYELFTNIRCATADNSERIQQAAALLAKLDVYCSLAAVAAANGYVCPSLNSSGMTDIRDGRHPVVERFVKDGSFVPNDAHLDMKNNRVMIITGPNMAGKSTYMRQVALITLMTQIGSFVPAASADMCIVDRLFTRVGASDDLASGQSTFMLEMNEVATILRLATKNSLIIYDEVGRGTSTFDGMSIARAVLEYTHSKKVGAKTMFATHYHELSSMADELDGVFNCNVAVRKKGDDVIFLRRIVPGFTYDSYGIEVAKLSGMPNEVITRARKILAGLEAKSRAVSESESVEEPEDEVMNIGDIVTERVTSDILAADLNNMSPREALELLYDMQQRLKTVK